MIQHMTVSLCSTAHLIIICDVIEGSREAPGEVISLSSEKKHQAGGVGLKKGLLERKSFTLDAVQENIQ